MNLQFKPQKNSKKKRYLEERKLQILYRLICLKISKKQKKDI